LVRLHMCVCVYVYMCVCVCVSVCGSWFVIEHLLPRKEKFWYLAYSPEDYKLFGRHTHKGPASWSSGQRFWH
jgi:hypothetical protein